MNTCSECVRLAREYFEATTALKRAVKDFVEELRYGRVEDLLRSTREVRLRCQDARFALETHRMIHPSPWWTERETIGRSAN
jgi:hypothetical protein